MLTQDPGHPIRVRFGLCPLKPGSARHGLNTQEGAVVQGDGDGHAGTLRLLATQPLIPGMPPTIRTNLITNQG